QPARAQLDAGFHAAGVDDPVGVPHVFTRLAARPEVDAAAAFGVGADRAQAAGDGVEPAVSAHRLDPGRDFRREPVAVDIPVAHGVAQEATLLGRVQRAPQ